MKELKKYYRQIKRWLPCGGKTKKRLMENIQSTVKEYLANNPEADFSAVQARFGTPQQIAASFIDEMDTAELLGKIRIRRRITSIITASVLLALLFWGTFLAIALADEISNSYGYDKTEIVIISSES